MSRAYGYNSYGGPEVETWFDRDIPHPSPSELVIEVHAIGVNPVDWKLRTGRYANPDAPPEFPLVVGVEAAGTVVAVGADVTGFSEGEPVFGTGSGTYAEHAVMTAADTFAKPPQLGFVEAAGLPVAAGTAWDTLQALHLSAGETLLINGAGGGVGVMLAQLARDRDIAVFGTGSESKRAMVESLGATLIPYDQVDVVERMREILPGGVDAIADCVGGASLKEVAILITDPARIVSIADPGAAELGGTYLMGSMAGVPQVAELAAAGKVDPKILQTYPFEEAGEALRSVESGHTLGKIVIDRAKTTAE